MLVKIIALSHGVQSCRVGYKSEYIIERCEQAAKFCAKYESKAFEVAMRFAELYGAAIINYESDESMERVVDDAAAKLDMEWYKMFSSMLPVTEDEVSVDAIALSAEAEDVVAKIVKDYEDKLTELSSKLAELTEGKIEATATEVTSPSDGEATTGTEKQTVDLSQIPIAVLGITKALKTSLLVLGCQTVADVISRHAEKPLADEAGIGEKSQQMILDAIAKLS